MKASLYADIELPRAAVQRIIKNSSEGKLVQKDAKLACTKAATVFISYLTVAAQDMAVASNQKTLSATHILQAIESIGFGNEFGPALKEALENIRKQALLAKEAKMNSAAIESSKESSSAGQLLDVGEDNDNTQMDEENDI